MTDDGQTQDKQGTIAGHLQGRIEAILFVAGEPVFVEELAKALSVTMETLEDTLTAIKDAYDFDQRGFMIRRFGDRVQLATRPLYAADVVRLLQPIQKQSLSQAAMETLAVVAYKQPITRAEVEQIRGVKCDYSLQSLMNKNLVREMGRKDAVGRPILYGTTPEFLVHFGIGSLEELPAMPQAGGTSMERLPQESREGVVEQMSLPLADQSAAQNDSSERGDEQ